MLKKLSKQLYFLLIWLIWSISLFGLVFAAPDHFDIEVRPNPMSVNQPADIIIKILDKDGIVVKDYQQDIFIESETDKLSDSEVEFPWWWIYQFQPTDQWNKIFSKWFIVKKEWTFKIIVTDILKQDIRWETTVVVKKDWLLGYDIYTYIKSFLYFLLSHFLCPNNYIFC
jgi:hypothetical protein